MRAFGSGFHERLSPEDLSHWLTSYNSRFVSLGNLVAARSDITAYDPHQLVDDDPTKADSETQWQPDPPPRCLWHARSNGCLCYA